MGHSADEGIGEREGLEGRREAGDRERRHEWCREERGDGDKKMGRTGEWRIGDKVLGLLGWI